ncbi:RluA family pseudouridine synthase [Parasphingorhabdus sp. JC815]|uniref:RluA family pseudouridine synthase n=1 Tax=Parasphingorhabdus sp. JC815 TaxID=3232140 RepID=UPI0034598697
MTAGHSIKSGIVPEIEKKQRLDAALAGLFDDLSRERIKQLITNGNLLIEGATCTDPSSKKCAGRAFALTVPEQIDGPAQAQNIPLDVVYEDDHLIIVNKPAGLVVHPAAGHRDGTLVNALLYHCNGQLSRMDEPTRPGIVHRIDKDTSGLMVAAKTDRAHDGLAALFATHDIERRYLAICNGRPNPPSATIEGNIGRSNTHRKKMAVVGDDKGKAAITHYTIKTPLNGATLIECALETGRTHQVRVHMAHIGHSLIGDPLYGTRRKSLLASRKDIQFCRQALHAATLGFVHPISEKKLLFNCNFPSDMQELFSKLRV